ncbi:MAG: archease [Methyloceanibacter sp.]|jgi:SHS2 domain-containing protein
MIVQSNMHAPGWEGFPHGADVGIRGWGPTLEQAFEQAALALTGVLTDADVETRNSVEVECDAPNVEVLFVEWLNAIIYEMAVRNMIFGAFKVTIEDLHLRGTIWGEPVDQKKHAPACEPKGATYTALRVAQGEDGTFLAECVIDV